MKKRLQIVVLVHGIQVIESIQFRHDSRLRHVGLAIIDLGKPHKVRLLKIFGDAGMERAAQSFSLITDHINGLQKIVCRFDMKESNVVADLPRSDLLVKRGNLWIQRLKRFLNGRIQRTDGRKLSEILFRVDQCFRQHEFRHFHAQKCF